jgi:very-short-patch-repair endonuclease
MHTGRDRTCGRDDRLHDGRMPQHPHRLRRPRTPLVEWLRQRGGIAHRHHALDAGYPPHSLREEVANGGVLRIRRNWLALGTAQQDLTTAADSGGILACVSAARHRGWWIPQDAAADTRVHVSVSPHAAVPRGDVRVHWSRPIVNVGRGALLESVEDTLQHVADCLPREDALVVWESAARIERLSAEYLTNVAWTSPDARSRADEVQGLADSGLETIFVSRVRTFGVPVRQQVVIAGRPVDALLGRSLAVQVDGFAFHSSAADRGRDVAHDAELTARGYTVLRFTYAQVVHDWSSVERAIGRALASNAHGKRRS